MARARKTTDKPASGKRENFASFQSAGGKGGFRIRGRRISRAARAPDGSLRRREAWDDWTARWR